MPLRFIKLRIIWKLHLQNFEVYKDKINQKLKGIELEINDTKVWFVKDIWDLFCSDSSADDLNMFVQSEKSLQTYAHI